MAPGGARTEYTCNDRGHVTAVRNAVGESTRITTDAAGLQIRITAPSGTPTILSRAAFGRVIQAATPWGSTLPQGRTTGGQLAWFVQPPRRIAAKRRTLLSRSACAGAPAPLSARRRPRRPGRARHRRLPSWFR
ncbi:hypothetical protein ACIP4R_35580 [Streptomyces echinatus]|uniref:hypothetical protein n=1 Tax=Streptomyces echinatus TaxID=67293 RepID=UPI003817ED3D